MSLFEATSNLFQFYQKGFTIQIPLILLFTLHSSPMEIICYYTKACLTLDIKIWWFCERMSMVFDSYIAATTVDINALFALVMTDHTSRIALEKELTKLHRTLNSSGFFGWCATNIQQCFIPGPEWNFFLNLKRNGHNDLVWGNGSGAQIWIHCNEPKFVLTWVCS